MKKLFIVAVVASFGMVSCKKDYTCECTTTSGGQTSKTTSTIKAKKDDAKKTCESASISSGSSSISCKIK